MRIRNANIYTEEHRFVRGDAAVENGRFVSCTGDPAGEEAVVDAKGMYLIPGLVDIHFHGCKGADMCDGTKEALDVITSYEASVGVMGPKKAFCTISALSSPLATINIFFACIMVLIPMVYACNGTGGW